MSDGPTPSGSSYLATFRSCKRKHYIRHILKLEKRERPNYFTIGTLVHKGHELVPSIGLERSLTEVRDAYEKGIQRMPPEGQEHVLTLVENILEEYYKKYQNDEFEVVIPEFEGFVDLVDPESGDSHRYTFKIDAIVSSGDSLFVKECKTSGEAPSVFLRKFSMDSQITGYFLGAQTQSPKPISGVIVDAVFKPRKKKDGSFSLLTEKDHDTAFQRELFTRSKEEIQDFILATIVTFREIKALPVDDMSKWVKNTDACFSKYSACEYLDLCKYQMDPRIIEAEYCIVEEKSNGPNLV